MTALDNLIKLTNLDCLNLVDLTKTSDGFYLGRKIGDIGFNTFIGKPKPVHSGPGLNRSKCTWQSLDDTEKTLVKAIAYNKGISLKSEFGIE